MVSKAKTLRGRVIASLLSLVLALACATVIQSCASSSQPEPQAQPEAAPIEEAQSERAPSASHVDEADVADPSAPGEPASVDEAPPYDGMDIVQVNGGIPVFSDDELCALGVEDYFALDSLARAPASVDEAPPYDGMDIVQVNGGIPVFSDDELCALGVEDYFALDSLARATGAFAVVGLETMPTEERGSIGMIKPSGWVMARYDFVDGSYLYNRCHLIGFQLTGENANERNLITGTRFLNVDLMLPYENAVADYVERTGNHVAYRATPHYAGDDLVATAVQLEALSVEDDGAGVCFNVLLYNVQTGNHVAYRATPHYAGDDLVATAVQLEALSVEDDGAGVCFNVLLYNVQPGVVIDYATGKSQADGSIAEDEGLDESHYDYILNVNSKKFHRPECSSVDDMKEENKQGFTGTREKAIELGYEPCGRCKP